MGFIKKHHFYFVSSWNVSVCMWCLCSITIVIIVEIVTKVWTKYIYHVCYCKDISILFRMMNLFFTLHKMGVRNLLSFFYFLLLFCWLICFVGGFFILFFLIVVFFFLFIFMQQLCAMSFKWSRNRPMWCAYMKHSYAMLSQINLEWNQMILFMSRSIFQELLSSLPLHIHSKQQQQKNEMRWNLTTNK